MRKKVFLVHKRLKNMSTDIRKISVIGLGYVGLPLFVALTKLNKYQVVGYTRSKERVNNILKGKSLIDDEEIDKFLFENRYNLKQNVSNDPEILKNSNVFIVCVPTPVKSDYSPDYGPLISATSLISKYLQKGDHVIIESTVNPGTCEEIILPILEKETSLKGGVDFNLYHCPERINPGDKRWNIYNIPRVIGALSKKMSAPIVKLYREIIKNGEVYEVDNIKIAEASKIIENSFRDINIAFVNELAQSFDTLGIDLIQSLKAASTKPFGFLVHWPGIGVGGHCIPVDPYYLIRRASLSGFNHRFLKIAREINENMPEYAIKKLLYAFNELEMPVKNKRIGILGVSYKADIGDTRNSPAFRVIKLLKDLEAKIHIHDPYVKPYNQLSLKEFILSNRLDGIILVTDHSLYKKNLVAYLKTQNSVKIIIDGRNCLDKNKIKKLNIIYKGIGR